MSGLCESGAYTAVIIPSDLLLQARHPLVRPDETRRAFTAGGGTFPEGARKACNER